jgi:hypothetical protein
LDTHSVLESLQRLAVSQVPVARPLSRDRVSAALSSDGDSEVDYQQHRMRCLSLKDDGRVCEADISLVKSHSHRLRLEIDVASQTVKGLAWYCTCNKEPIGYTYSEGAAEGLRWLPDTQSKPRWVCHVCNDVVNSPEEHLKKCEGSSFGLVDRFHGCRCDTCTDPKTASRGVPLISRPLHRKTPQRRRVPS